ncbi:MAG TPA: plastocyanin/azurin family copper-binding protein [Longilinea sp.]|nr:plastocyanin/azurin family copper-binding protein [Longilinea sp.]
MRRSILLTTVLCAIFILSACTANSGYSPQSTAAPTTAPTSAAASGGGLDVITVNTVDNPTLGKILVNSQGMTLYLYTKDTPNTSNCYDKCATNWPPLLVTGTPTGGVDIDTAKLGTTKRTDGSMQVTYNGWPLYTYIADKKAGDTTGQNVGSVWFVISPAGDQVSAASDDTANASDDYGKVAVETPVASSGQAVTEGSNIDVSIASFQFTPSNLTVLVGTTITWTNNDSAAHTITANDGSFSSGNLNKGGTFSFTFAKEGTFTYYCENHTSMKALVTVVP